MNQSRSIDFGPLQSSLPNFQGLFQILISMNGKQLVPVLPWKPYRSPFGTNLKSNVRFPTLRSRSGLPSHPG